MSEPILILGASGSGKSYSQRNLDPAKTFIISVDGKRLPFKSKDWAEFNNENTDGSFYRPPKSRTYDRIKKAITCAVEKGKKSIIIDDSQYLLCNEFFQRAYEKGFDKFTEIATKFHDLIDFSRTLPDDVLVYFLHHVDYDNENRMKAKTVGKMIEEKTNLEGKFTVCLFATKQDGTHKFFCSLPDETIVKAPPEMFDGDEMDNDLNKVDQCIREFWI